MAGREEKRSHINIKSVSYHTGSGRLQGAGLRSHGLILQAADSYLPIPPPLPSGIASKEGLPYPS